MPTLDLKPTHKPIRDYYAEIGQLRLLSHTNEGAVRGAFGALLQQCAREFKWTLVNEYEIKRRKRMPLRVDGALVDGWSLAHGYWEAKDQQDDLAVEAKKKIALGYPTDNIIFQAPERAILYQDGKCVWDDSILRPEALVEVLREFFRYEPPHFAEWDRAVLEFKDKVPQLGQALIAVIEKERKGNQRFVKAFAKFMEVCRASINPQLSDASVEKMLVQHLLTERIFRKVFDNPDFARRNIIANEIEQVVDALTSRAFNREKFLAGLDRFYGAIESTAATIDDFSEKQGFLNSLFENFFQGFDEKTADTHGIVYTPQSIVRFMVRSVDEILQREFGRSLGDKNVHILDPFVGTGNFILNVMRHIPRTQLPHKYANELHANEVMLLPYYIASMNIEHEYAELAGEYKPFEGLCLVDTFELAESRQAALFTEKNAERVERQKRAPITVIIGNPPYNAWQADENDRNKNRKHSTVDERVAETYAKDSSAMLVNSLSDPYVKAFRWAADRIGDEGVLAYVSNNSYVSNLAFDGMRKNLAKDFDEIYVLDLGGNVRKNPKLSGTTHNVFGIQVGVAIGLFVKRKRKTGQRKAKVFYAKTGEDWRREQKYKHMDDASSVKEISWEHVTPDVKATWLQQGLRNDFNDIIPLHAAADSAREEPRSIFAFTTNGLKSNNDAYVFNFDHDALIMHAQKMVDTYNGERLRWIASKCPEEIEAFLKSDLSNIKWIHDTKQYLRRGVVARWNPARMRPAIFKPFTRTWLFFDGMFNNRLYQLESVFPDVDAKNRAISATGVGARSPFSALIVDAIPEQHLGASTDAYQNFPRWTYGTASQDRRDNITDWALAEFRKHYADKKITKDAIFHYVYGLLHSPEYRTRYEANLKRDLPRIPFAPDFRAFAKAGERLAALHIGYEQQKEFRLKRVENREVPLDWRVERMKLSKDRTSIVYNEFLTLASIPLEAFEYRLGNRSALEWIIDQYQVSTDKRSGIVNDPNRLNDPEYIVRLIGQVITVSVETVRVVKSLPAIGVAA